MEEIIKLLIKKGYRPRFIDYSKNAEDRYLETALAIKWIRENFGISISANREAYYQEVYNKYVYSITWPLSAEPKPVASPYFEKSEEAIEAALLYTLKNFIS